MSSMIGGISGEEIAETNWPEEHFHIAGRRPKGVIGKPKTHLNRSGIDALKELVTKEPEFLVIAAHGFFDTALNEFGPVLRLSQREYLSQFNLIKDKELRLRHNKLTLLNACVAGQGTDAGGGDVAGFVRALMAARAGAIGLPLWSVKDKLIAASARDLLRNASHACNNDGFFDCVDVLFRYNRSACHEGIPANERIEACPIVLYL